jgi:hypothetical protein
MNYSQSILVEGRSTSKGKKVKEALDTIILLIEKELEK